MVIDSSALIAILDGEAEGERFAAAIEADRVRLISAATYAESAVVMEARYGSSGSRDLQSLLERAQFEIVPFDRAQAEWALRAYRQFGKRHHRAGLNLGDCFSYALSKTSGEPLLFKGGDFGRTDLTISPASVADN